MASLTALSLYLSRKAVLLSIILTLSFILSRLARMHWFFDLFTHFMIQYAVGGAILALALFCFGQWFFGTLCLAVCLASTWHIWQAMPMNADPQAQGPRFTVAQYNRFYFNTRDDLLLSWLRENSEKFDVVSVQEITKDAVNMLQAVNDIYPYHFPPHKKGGTDVFLLSKTPILESELIETENKLCRSALGMRIKVQGRSGPHVTIYAIHTHTPIGLIPHCKRTQELATMANAIASDTSQNIIFMGDWNITPFSPYFQQTLQTSTLQNGYSERWPAVTWPSKLVLPFLKIPIDQILFSNSMTLIEKTVPPAMKSDHHPVVASFALKADN